MRIDGQRSDYHEGRPIFRDCGDLIGILCPFGHVVSHTRKVDWAGSHWQAKASDPNFKVRCCGSLPPVVELASALPTINPTASPEQHASAAARMLADMAD